MTTALALFDLTALDPATTDCARCGQHPATARVHAAHNLLGVTRYPQATYRNLAPITSAPCCDTCAWNLANAWWASWQTCPTGVCALWVHTLADPHPGWDCKRSHREQTVVWLAPLAEVA